MPRGVAGTQMSGLPVEHYRHPEDGGALCRSKRRWGVLLTRDPVAVTCRRCRALIQKLHVPVEEVLR